MNRQRPVKKIRKIFKKVKLDANVRFWSNSGELISSIKSSLNELIKTTPTNGWIKGNEIFEISPKDNPLLFGLKVIYQCGRY